MTNDKDLGKRIQNQTIHVQYTGTQQIHLYLIGSNMQFSTNTE